MMQSKTFMIRRATDQDRAIQREIIREAWEGAYTHIFTLEEINALFNGQLQQASTWEHLRREFIRGFVAEADGQIVGTAGLALRIDDEGELVSLYVRPHDQGQGIGRALWNASINLFRELGCRGMRVWVLERAAAVHFYEQQGCELIEYGTYQIGDHQERARGYRLAL